MIRENCTIPGHLDVLKQTQRPYLIDNKAKKNLKKVDPDRTREDGYAFSAALNRLTTLCIIC